MQPTRSVGRNEPCPCGSGRKFKACCQGKLASATQSRSPARGVIIGCVALVIAFAIGKAVFDARERGRTPASAASDIPLSQSGSIGGLTPPSPGAAPPGKVWSQEHGHWHDLPGGGEAAGNANPSSGPGTPPPPGPAPAGKVWSAEHGHWHDAPATSGTAVTTGQNASAPGSALTPQPPGPAPEGKVWSAEHGHWHDLSAPADSSSVTPIETFPAVQPVPVAPTEPK
jgi:hypothetical protein